MQPERLTNSQARRLFLQRHLLTGRGSGPAEGAALARLLGQLGFVQVDSVNTLARAHDLILWSRLGRYRPEALTDLVGRHRLAFEHWTHDASVIPMDFYPMWRLKFDRDAKAMRHYRRGGNWHAELDNVVRHVEAHGPVTSADLVPSEKRGSDGWWDWHPSKAALDYLWRSGRLAVRQREGFRKVYDLAERVIPEPVFGLHPDEASVTDWALRAALERLGFGTAKELAAFFAILTPAEAQAWCQEQKAAGQLLAVDVEQADGSLRPALTTPALLELAHRLPPPGPRVRILSPFDPALRDRARAERLFGFHYRIEIYVPAPQRRYGYYVFPVLQGERLIGRLDAARKDGRLQVTAFWPEPGQRPGQTRLAGLQLELERIAAFAGLTEISYAPDWLRQPLLDKSDM